MKITVDRNIPKRSIYLDFIKQMHDIKSCSDLTKSGIVESGEFNLDLIQDHKPVKAWCNLPEGETVLGQNSSIEVGHCTGSRCFPEDLTYDNSLDEIVALMDSSSECRQDITFICNLAPLQVKIIINCSKYLQQDKYILGWSSFNFEPKV